MNLQTVRSWTSYFCRDQEEFSSSAGKYAPWQRCALDLAEVSLHCRWVEPCTVRQDGPSFRRRFAVENWPCCVHVGGPEKSDRTSASHQIVLIKNVGHQPDDSHGPYSSNLKLKSTALEIRLPPDYCEKRPMHGPTFSATNVMHFHLGFLIHDSQRSKSDITVNEIHRIQYETHETTLCNSTGFQTMPKFMRSSRITSVSIELWWFDGSPGAESEWLQSKTATRFFWLS